MTDRPRIVVLDGQSLNPGDLSWDELAVLGELEVYDRTPSSEVVSRAVNADILVVNKVGLTAALISSLPRLRMIAITATGYDNVDIEFARRQDIVVSNAVGYSTDAVVQYVLACVFHALQGLDEHGRAVKEGAWSSRDTFSFTLFPINEWKSRTLGIMGLGNIGTALARQAVALGMPVKAWNRTPRPKMEGIDQVDIDTLLSTSDLISLHLPLNEDTRYILSESAFGRMKKGAIVINAGRGGLIRSEHLLDVLGSGRVARAYLDVLEKEPPLPGDPLVDHPATLVTPHLAWSSVQARKTLMTQTAENIRSFLTGRPIRVL